MALRLTCLLSALKLQQLECVRKLVHADVCLLAHRRECTPRHETLLEGLAVLLYAKAAGVMYDRPRDWSGATFPLGEGTLYSTDCGTVSSPQRTLWLR